MKFSKFKGLLGLIIAVGACFGLHAQIITTTSVPNMMTNSPAGGFFATAYSWATTSNPSNSLDNVKVEVDSGYLQQAGTGARSYLAVQRDIGDFNIGLQAEYFGIGSAFNSVELQGGYTLYRHVDFKIEANFLVGRDFYRNAWEFEPELRAVKMLTKYTYITAGYSLPAFDRGTFNAVGQVKAGAGFTFN